MKWQCRRGTKELDTLLGGFLERHFSGLDESHQAAFAELLELQDPTISDWIWGRVPVPDGDLGDIIRVIRQDSGLDS